MAPAALAYFRPPAAPPHEPFRLVVEDPTVGAIALSGALHAPPAARTLVVALHGLGGSAESSYMRQLATAAVGAGCACLRLNHRGAERAAQDYYHAGLTVDRESVLAAEELARFERVAVVGFSLGGHVALRYAAERPGKTDPRLAGVVAVCAPLDLDRGARRALLLALSALHPARPAAAHRCGGEVAAGARRSRAPGAGARHP